MEFSSYAPGTPCWIDLSTTDPAAAKTFYTKLMGWEAVDVPAGPDQVYTMLRLRGKEVCALSAQPPMMKGMPPVWSTYISVANVDETAQRTATLGGKVVAPPFDVLDAGRMAVIQDPTGAHLSFWQAKKHIGAQICNEPGSLCWNELLTRDVNRAKAFYTELLGWKCETSSMGTGSYTQGMLGGKAIVGMMDMPPGVPAQVPANWMVYFAVNDCDETVKQATALGGKVNMPATDIPTVGRFAVLSDPQGGVFAAIKLARQ